MKSQTRPLWPKAIERELGMDVVRRLTAEMCLSEPARKMVAAMAFDTNVDTVWEALSLTAEMKQALQRPQAPFSLAGLTDVRPCLSTLRREGTYVEAEDLATLRTVLALARDVKADLATLSDRQGTESVERPGLEELVGRMPEVQGLVRIIDSVVSNHATVKDTASETLAEIRRGRATIQGRISATMKRVLTHAIKEGIVEADAQPLLREGRMVLPVSSMHKRRMMGIVHDRSATGRTLFIEPAEVVELAGEGRELEIAERREIIRILRDIAERLRPHLEELKEVTEILYTLDFIRAKALFALKTGGNLTVIEKNPVFLWHDAVNPILKLNLEARGGRVVPLNVELSEDTARILVISGPNAGGKSVALKTVGLNQLMMQCGMLPTMDARSRMGMTNGIFVDMGDNQSMEDDLSTYSSHLKAMKYILNHGSNRSLVLIDEFGGGTEPKIGGAIAQALLAEFNARGMWGIVTTHYQNIKEFAGETEGIVNGGMAYDREHMKPTFRLLTGSPGSSLAVEIALRTGLPRSIIDEAERIVGSDYFNVDKFLLDITRDRRYWEKKRHDIHKREKHLEEVIARYEEDAERLRSERRAIISEAKADAAQIVARSNAAIERTINEIRRLQADKEATRKLRAELREEVNMIENTNLPENPVLGKAPRIRKSSKPKTEEIPQTINVGDSVLLDKQGAPGRVLEIAKDKATVSFGVMKMTVPLERLSRTIKKVQSGAKVGGGAGIVTEQTLEASRRRQLDFKTEIDVRGMRADEAIQAVTYFIDDALQFNAGRVRILHGTGTGALRQAIRQYLRTVAGVTRFSDEDVRFGGAGITVVEL